MEELLKKYREYVRNLERNMDVMTFTTRDVVKHKIAAYNEIITDLENLCEGKETPDEQSNCIKPAVINPVCPLCGDTGFYTYGGLFGGAVQTMRCGCGANGL